MDDIGGASADDPVTTNRPQALGSLQSGAMPTLAVGMYFRLKRESVFTQARDGT
jgi:hypothetical protein